MPTIQLRFNAAASKDPLAHVSTEFPKTPFTVLASHLTDDGLLGLVEIATKAPTEIIRQFDDVPKMDSHEVVYTDEQTVVIQYQFPEAEPYRALRATGNIPHFLPKCKTDGCLQR